MSYTVKLPKFGLSMESATIGSWEKNPGDSVKEGEGLVEVETDKITNTVESPVSGVVRSILVEEGDEATVGQELCVIDEE